MCEQDLQTVQTQTLHCTICRKHFRTEVGKAHHKSTAERQLPIEEQSSVRDVSADSGVEED